MNKVFKNILLSIGFALCLCSINVFAVDMNMLLRLRDIDVIVNDQKVDLGKDAVIKNNRVLVKLREIYKDGRYEVLQDEDKGTVEIRRGFKRVKFTIGLDKVIINNEKKCIDVSPIIIGNKTYLPLRALEEALGNEVLWDEDKNMIIIKEDVQEVDFNFSQEISAKNIAMKYYKEDAVFVEKTVLGQDECYVFNKTRTAVPSIAVEKDGNKVYLIKEDYDVYKILETVVYKD